MLTVNRITKHLPDGTPILKGISFSVTKGEFVGILGPSGAGKTLTMRCLNGLTKPSSGEVLIHEPQNGGHSIDITSCSGTSLRKARRKIGMIFQGFNLVKRISVLENVLIGRLGDIHPFRSLIYGFTDAEAEEALTVLEKLKIGHLAYRKTGTLSGGEMQRTAIARAIFQNPLLLLADEPIANLDPSNAQSIMELLHQLSREIPIVGVFHQPSTAMQFCTRLIAIKSGEIWYDGVPHLSQVQLLQLYGAELSEVEKNTGEPVGSQLLAIPRNFML